MIWAIIISQSCFCWLYIASPSLAAKNVISLISVSAIWWCPYVESSLVLLEEGVCYDKCVLLAKLYKSLLSNISEKVMATHSSTLTWKIPWMEEPGRLQSMGSRRVRQDWVTSFSLFTFMHWRRKWQPTLVFLPGESQGQQSLVGCCLWGRTESDTTEVT